MHRAGVALALVVTAFVATTVGAEEPAARVRLQWERAPGSESCLGPDELRTLVEEQLGRSVFPSERSDLSPDLLIDGRIEPVTTPAGWRAIIRARRPDGELLGTRELVRHTDDCRRLDRALALVVALTIDRGATVPPPEPPALERPVPPPRVAPAPRVSVAPSASRPPWRFGTSLGVVGSVGLLPSTSVAIAGAVSVDAPALPPLEIGVSSWLEEDELAAGGGVRVDLITGGLATCPAVGVSSLRLGGCAGFELGRMRAAGFGFAANQARTETLVHARLGGRLEVPLLGRLVLRGIAGVWIPLVRPRFYVDDGPARREIFQTAPVAGVAGLDLFWSF